MKIRNGFVSNSSSSSFVAVGVGAEGYGTSKKDGKVLINILNAMGIPTESHDYDDFCPDGKYADKLNDCGYGIYKTVDGSELYFYGGYEFYFVGLDAMPLIEKDMKLSEIKKLFQKVVKDNYGVKVNLSQIELRSDEVSSEG